MRASTTADAYVASEAVAAASGGAAAAAAHAARANGAGGRVGGGRRARMFGHAPAVQLVPFRGEYAVLSESAAPMVRGSMRAGRGQLGRLPTIGPVTPTKIYAPLDRDQ
mgnify:CR=1 FL=1